MKFKKIFEEIFLEEKITQAFEYKKICASQSYYFLYSSFKIAVLLNKDGLRDNKRHWVNDELIGNSLARLVIYYNGKLTSKEIYDCLMLNFSNNYSRLVKDASSEYKKFLSKEDLSEENILSLANIYYKKFADWIVKNKDYLKGLDNTYDFKKKFVDENYKL